MDNNQTNDNELQQAIEDITSNSGGASSDAVAELEAKLQGQSGVAPMMPEITPPASAEGVPMPDMAAATDKPVLAPLGDSAVNPAMVETPESVAQEIANAAAETLEVAAPAAPVEETPASTEVPGDLAGVKDAMLRDLFPLMDKIELSSERKNELYKQALDKDGDKNLIPAAYEAVKGIADEAERAAALLYLVEEAEK